MEQMEQQTILSGYKKPRKKKKPLAVREVSPQYWSDIEVLTLIVGTDAAKEILSAVDNNLFSLHDLEPEQLAQYDGIGPAKALQIKASLELGRRISGSKLPKGTIITSPQDVYNFLREEMRYHKKEHFEIILLNTKNQIISVENISVGSLNSTIVHPREIFNPAIKKSAASLILVHNHPSGDPAPSCQDVEITKQLVEGSKILGIKILDHIIIGDDQYSSFKERGLME